MNNEIININRDVLQIPIIALAILLSSEKRFTIDQFDTVLNKIIDNNKSAVTRSQARAIYGDLFRNKEQWKPEIIDGGID